MAWPLAIQQNADDKQCWFTPCCDMRALAAAIHILQLWRRNVTRPAALSTFTVELITGLSRAKKIASAERLA